jgi:RNA polymerase sigma-70 factor (ECF subfamily)
MRTIGPVPLATAIDAFRLPGEARRLAMVMNKASSRPMTSEPENPAPGSELASLIAAVARDRDRAAFGRIFEQFAPRIKTMMMRMGAAAEESEELTQEAMLAVWRKAHLFDPNGTSASGWIFRIAHNLRIDAVRRARRIDASGTDPTIELPEVAPPDHLVAARQIDARVRRAVAQLNPEQLQVITLSFFENRPHAEIAAALKLPLGTVKSRLRLAFKRLRALLDEVA